jgi:hypothetical protein
VENVDQLSIIFNKFVKKNGQSLPWRVGQSSIARPSKIYPNLEFWFDITQSGNPDSLQIVSLARRRLCVSGLPDGLFSNQKSQFGKKFQGLRLENVDTFYGHLEYFMDIWDILSPFVTFCVHLVHFFSFGIMRIMHKEKSGNPGVFTCFPRKWGGGAKFAIIWQM